MSIDSESISDCDSGNRLTPYAVPILLVHVLACGAFIPWCFSWAGVAVLFGGVMIFGQGINLGYHRLLSHRSLVVPKWLERGYVLLAICCMEESPAKWVSTHRLHHAHSDAHEDPHSPTTTFFWSHMGWLLRSIPQRNQLGVHRRFAHDILEDRFYVFLERAWWFGMAVYGLQLVAYFCVGLVLHQWNWIHSTTPLQAGLSLVVWGVFLRTVAIWHITWSVNSLGHVFGYRSYPTTENSRNNWLVGLLASGEGWHNNHHHDPASASVQHRWWELDLTYYQILVLEKLGLASRVIRPRHRRRSSDSDGRHEPVDELSAAGQLCHDTQTDAPPEQMENATGIPSS